MTPLDILRIGRERIAAGHWCKGAEALDSLGRIVGAGDPEADYFCAMGAVVPPDLQERDRPALDAAKEFLEAALRARTVPADHDTLTVGNYNDLYYTTRLDVLSLYDQAMRLAEAE